MVYIPSKAYTTNAEDTLRLITQFLLGDSNCWNKRLKPDSTKFTQDRVKHLQQSQETRFSLSRRGMSKGSFLDTLKALGEFKSGLPKEDLNQYQVENTLGFIGKYQFGEPLLISLGYYRASVYYGRGSDKNYWRGTWTGKKGIDSKSDFLSSPDVQEFAIREAFALNWSRINDRLKGQGKSLDDYIGHKKIFNDSGMTRSITITLSGILAAAYLRGPYGVAELLLKNRATHDEFSTSILQYMDEYGGYETTPADFINSDS